MKNCEKYIVRIAEGITFEISTDNLEKAKAYEDEIIGKIMTSAYYHNDLTGELWMFDMKLTEADGKSVWLENIHPANDLSKVECLILFN